MNQVRRIAKIVMNVLCILLFIILVLVIYAKLKVTFTENKASANYFGYRIFEIASGSMEPTLKKNDIILVKVNNKDIKKDDVISYVGENDAIITHRVVRIEDDSLIVKGDANNTTDTPIERNQVIGKMVKSYAGLGIWKRILTEPKTLILLFITFLFFDAALSYDPKKQDKEKSTEDVEKEKIVKIEEEPNDEFEEKELLDFTRKIDLNEIDSLLEKNKDKEKKKDEIEVLSEYADGYTVRLDLNEIQKNIENMNK